MSQWPRQLPGPVLDRIQIERQDALLRSTMDTGAQKVRKRFTKVAEYWQVTWSFTEDQRLLLRDFYVNTLEEGALSFEWPNPYSLDGEKYADLFTTVWDSPKGSGSWTQVAYEATFQFMQARFRKPYSERITQAGEKVPILSQAGQQRLRLPVFWEVSAELEVWA